MTKVKICGLKEAQHVKAAQRADAIGFVFAPSKRQVTIEQAAQLAKYAPVDTDKIGVFVNASLQEIEDAVAGVPLTMVQLHGDEPDELVEAIRVPVIQAFSDRKSVV